MNNTEIIIYQQQLLSNSKFVNQYSYEWIYSGKWLRNENSITHLTGTTDFLYQTNIIRIGSQYQLKFNLNGRTAGDVRILNSIGGSALITYTANGNYTFDFTATNTDLVFRVTSSFDGTISNATLYELPLYYNIDVSNDVDIPFNFSIDDILKLNQRKTAFTKTVNLIGTPNNNKAFNDIYKINVDSKFNPTKKRRVVVKNCGLVLFDGTICLDNIIKKIKNNVESIVYQVTFYGESFSIFDKLGQKNIKDLDFSRWNHPFTLGILRSNWCTGNNESYVWDNNTTPTVGWNPYIKSQTTTGTQPSVSAISSNSYKGNLCVCIQFSSNHSLSIGDNIFINSDNNLLSGTHIVVDLPTLDKIVIPMAYVNLSSTTFTNCVVIKRTWNSEGYWYPMSDSGTFAEQLTAGATLYNGHLYTISKLDRYDDFSTIAYDPVLSPDPLTSGTLIPPADIVEGTTFIAYDGLGTYNTPINFTTPNVPINSGLLSIGSDYKIVNYKSPSSTFPYIGADNFSNVGGTGVGKPSQWNGVIFTATGTTPATWANKSDLVLLGGQPYWAASSVLQHYQTKDLGGKLYNKNNSVNNWYKQDFIPHIFVREVFNKMFTLIDYYYDCPIIDSDLVRRLVMPCLSTFNVNGGSLSNLSSLTVGVTYVIGEYQIGDDFTNVGASANVSGVSFVATGTSPTTWTHNSILLPLIIINDVLPNMSLSDFFISVLNLLDLVIIEDKVQKNLVHLVSRNDFFNGTIITDWQLDTSQDLSMKMASSIIPNKYIFKYKDSTDFFNLNYINDFGKITDLNRTYGDYQFKTGNELSKEENIIELKFEPTVMVGKLTGQYDKFNVGSGNDKVISAYYFADEQGLNAARKNANRILIAGLRGSNYPISITENYYGTGDLNGPVAATSGGNGSASYQDYDFRCGQYYARLYPYASHIDCHLDFIPNNDINFSSLAGQYFPHQTSGAYDLTKWFTRCIFERFWSKYILENTNHNARIITGSFKISINHIYNLDFQNVYQIKDFRLKLNKIMDWNLNGDGICKVEFSLKNI